MNQEKEKSEQQVKRGAKMEFIARITLEDGTVEERVIEVEGGVPGLSDSDFSSIDAVKRTFTAYEQSTVTASNKLREEIAKDHMKSMSKKNGKKG